MAGGRSGTICGLNVVVHGWIAIVVICGAVADVARADFVGSELVWVTMTDSAGRSGTVGIANPSEHLLPATWHPTQIEASITDRQPLTDGTHELGLVDAISVHLDGDPVASLAFAVTAGSSDVTVTINSAIVSFDTLMNPAASAEAEVTLTDNGGETATLTRIGGHAGLFRAIYNTHSEYASLLGDSAVAGGGVTYSQDTAGPIAGDVSSIHVQFAFQLSAGDSASGHGNFTVIPEPTSAAVLLAVCGVVSIARRRGRLHG